jgi:putative aldouronate transport system permease protein
MNRYNTVSGHIFDVFNYLFLFLISIVTIIPFVYILSASLSSPEEIAKSSFFIFPRGFTIEAYRYIFSTDTLIRSLMVSIYVTTLGTIINLIFTTTMAYPLAQHNLKGRNGVTMIVLFTMIFSGGIIPTYFIVKSLGMIDSLWALMIPVAISPFNLILLKNFFQQIPDEIKDSAKIDGCSHFGILFRIILPLSLPAIATFALFYAVHHWNMYFNAVMYLNDSSKWPLQVLLRQIVIMVQDKIGDGDVHAQEMHPQAVKMAVIVFATVPIMLVYPFLQKHFAKGVLLGSVKG